MKRQQEFWSEYAKGAPALKPRVHTSRTDPITVDWVPRWALGTPGALGMTFAPGKCNEHGTHGIHRRSLAADLTGLVRGALCPDVLVTLMEAPELVANGLGNLGETVGAYGLKWVLFPIRDTSIPTSLRETRDVVDGVRAHLAGGRNVVVHCRGGHGRTGLFVACLLTSAGHSAAEAIAIVRAARPGTIHNMAQADFVELFASERAARPARPKPRAR